MIIIAIIFIIALLLLVYLFHGKGVPVFLYHQVNDLSNIDKSLLEEHFKLISKLRYKSFTISEAREEIRTNGKMPSHSLMITFDDGYYDNYLNVFPLLKAYNVKATIFLNTAFIKEKATNRTLTKIQSSSIANQEAIDRYYKTGDAGSDQYLSWEEIKEMYNSGLCDFQAHTHTHNMAFASYKLRKIIEGNNFGREELSLFEGKVEDGLPVFYSRGETSVTKIKLKEDFLIDFRQFYFNELRPLKDKVRRNRAFKYLKNYSKGIGEAESEAEKEIRIRKEIRSNKELIESHLKNNVFAFAWPYGHHKSGIDIIKKEKISAFLTCKKGTNNPYINFDKIRRIELRNPTLSKFKWSLRVNSNLLLGKFYEFIS